jgi:phasin family protein
MTNTSNPFQNMDMSKFMTDFDPAKLADKFASLAGDYKLPGVDVNAIADAQRKNLETLQAANKAAIAGIQAVASRQGEILQKTLQEANDAIGDLARSQNIEDVSAKQAELLKGSFERAISNMKEVAELIAKSSAQTSELINSRIAESLDEMKKQTVKIKKKSA